MDNFLSHYGVIGMKWGIRRYETESGHLTPEGKERYGSKHGLKKAIRKTNKQLKKLGKAWESSKISSDKAREMTREFRQKFNNDYSSGKKISAKDYKKYKAANKTIDLATAATSYFEDAYKTAYNKAVKEFGKENITNINPSSKTNKEAERWVKMMWKTQTKWGK